MNDESDQQTDNVKKRAYKKPALKIYGHVRELTGAGGGTAMGDAGTMMPGTSDRCVKRNIVRIGDHPLGIGLYLFDYDPERGRAGGMIGSSASWPTRSRR